MLDVTAALANMVEAARRMRRKLEIKGSGDNLLRADQTIK